MTWRERFLKVTGPGLPLWATGGGILLLALLHEIFLPPWVAAFSRPQRLALWGAVLALALPAAYAALRLKAAYDRLLQRVAESERQADAAYRRLNAIFHVSQRFVEASDENEVIQLALQLSVELTGGMGASFVPLNEHGQPLPAVNFGEMPFPVMTDWVEYLASPGVRSRCGACEARGQLHSDGTCPLLQGPFSGAIGMFCLPLRRAEREFGVLNLFIPNVDMLDPQTQAFLRTLVDETALALEGVRLRRRELEALRQMQAVREKTDLSTLMPTLLEDVRQTFESDFAILAEKDGDPPARVVAGEFPAGSRPFLDGILHGTINSRKPLALGDVSGDPASAPGVTSLLAAPLLSAGGSALGVLLVGNCSGEPFHPRQLGLLQTVAGQVALVLQNANAMAELEYKIMFQERTRLAREIHDGLAQTLGFLKLQTAQLRNYLARNELDRLRQSADLCYTTLSEAYQDVRQAIDGLRIWPTESGLAGWLEQTVVEFEELSGIPVIVEGLEVEASFQPEVHAQLIRIVQEALSNVRKHARASRVVIALQKVNSDLWLEIRDDGLGFSPEDVPGPSQHGLRGMRERAELIGADFQVISRPEAGTTVRVTIPLLPVQPYTKGTAIN